MSQRHHDELLERIPAYALGALEGDELLEIEAHLQEGCPACDAELLLATGDLEALAEMVEPIEPSEMTRARLIKQVASRPSDSAGRPAGRPMRWAAIAAAAGLALLAVAIWQQVTLRGQLEELEAARAETELRLARASDELESVRNEVRRLRLANRIVGSPSRATVRLAGLESAPEAAGQTFVDAAAGRAVFYASNLEPAEPGTTYQLWFIAEGRPVSAGIFDVDEEGAAVVLVEETGAAEAIDLWAVTIEPAGGVPQPTGPMVLKG